MLTYENILRIISMSKVKFVLKELTFYWNFILLYILLCDYEMQITFKKFFNSEISICVGWRWFENTSQYNVL